MKASMEDLSHPRSRYADKSATPTLARRKYRQGQHPKSKHVEILSSDCGCRLPRSIKSQGKLGGLGKIWPLFKNLPPDFSAGGTDRRRYAGIDHSIARTAAAGVRSVSPNIISVRSFDSPPQSSVAGDATTPDHSDHASSSNEGVAKRMTDILDTELEALSKKLDIELVDSSKVQWEELSSALEREFEMLGYSCRQRRILSQSTSKFSSIDSEDWAVRMVREELNIHGPSKDVSPRSSSARRSSCQILAGSSDLFADNSYCSYALRERFHRAAVLPNKLSLKAEVGLNFVSISQFGQVMEKAGLSLEEFCSTLIKAKRNSMKRCSMHVSNSMDDKTVIGWAILRPLLPHATFALPDHVKFGVQACINEAVFRNFQTEAYGMRSANIDCPVNACADYCNDTSRFRLRQVTFLKEFYACECLRAEELMDSESNHFNETFQLFCRKKLKAVQKAIGWVGKWPSKLCETFLESMKRVWMAHKLAFALDNPAAMFYVNEQAEWDAEFMEALGMNESGEEGRLFDDNVEFMVLPGFSFREGGVVKSKVYLKPREGIRAMEEIDDVSPAV